MKLGHHNLIHLSSWLERAVNCGCKDTGIPVFRAERKSAPVTVIYVSYEEFRQRQARSYHNRTILNSRRDTVGLLGTSESPLHLVTARKNVA